MDVIGEAGRRTVVVGAGALAVQHVAKQGAICTERRYATGGCVVAPTLVRLADRPVMRRFSLRPIACVVDGTGLL